MSRAVAVSQEVGDYAGGNAEFAQWLAKADQVVTRRLGVGLFDLPDWDWLSAFEDGCSVTEAVTEFFDGEGFDVG